MKKLLPAFHKSKDIEHFLFEITLILTLSVFIFWCIYSVIADYSFVIKVIYFAALFLYSSIYIAYKLGLSFKWSTAIYYTIALIILTYSWLPAGGISGAIIQMFILIYVSGLMVLPLRTFMIFIATSLVIVLIYAYLELTTPGLAAPYLDEMDRVRDLSIANFITLCILGYGLYVFKKNYSDDRIRLKDTIQELEHEKEKALAADKAKSDFLATISHEMRTPLNGIVGLSELLSKTDLNEEQKEIVSKLSYSNEMLYSLISDLLDMTTIESGHLVLNENEIVIEKEITGVIELIRPKLKAKKRSVSLEIKFDSNIPGRVYGDINRFRQILLNLVNNAAKFTEKGSITVKAELVKDNNAATWVKFFVIDTGKGIEPEKQDHLFDKFYKVENDSNIEGSGLGLSITKNLVELMGGTIGYETEYGQGSKFYFELPFQKQTHENLKTEANREVEASYSDLKVLIAEDVLINQMVIEKMLINIGVSYIDVVSDGLEAVDKAAKADYDFIFMDIQMPELNGIDATKKILQDSSDEHKPIVVAVTANVSESDLEKYFEAGMVDSLPKPITIDILRNLIIKYKGTGS